MLMGTPLNYCHLFSFPHTYDLPLCNLILDITFPVPSLTSSKLLTSFVDTTAQVVSIMNKAALLDRLSVLDTNTVSDALDFLDLKGALRLAAVMGLPQDCRAC